MTDREIFEHNVERVLQFFVNKVRLPADANDLAQETFTRYFERAKRGDVKNPRAFILGVAYYVLKEYWKAKARRPMSLDPGERSIVDMGAAKTTLGSLLARQQGQGRVLDAMRLLRLDFQNVLELRYWHELPYKEIAEVLGQNESTVGVWLRRAKHDLRQALDSLAPKDEGNGEPFSPKALEDWLRRSGELAAEVMPAASKSDSSDG